MPRRSYISPEERTRFDTPPTLDAQQRLIMLDLPIWAETYLQSVRTPTNTVGFLLQLGYFRIVARFFVADRYDKDLIDWLRERMRLESNQVDLSAYATSRTAYRHRQYILEQLGYSPFDAKHQWALVKEAHRLAHLQTRPALMLDAMAGYLQERRIEIPPYNTLRLVIIDALAAFQASLEEIIDQHLQPGERHVLDALLEKQVGTPGAATAWLRYGLTDLKRITQSMQPGQIRQRVDLFIQLKALFIPLAPLIVRLNLSDDTIRYYAQYVLDTQSKQTAQRTSERYLRLISFVVHQYLGVGDALILTLRHAVTTTLNQCEQVLKEEYYLNRYATAQLVHQVSRRSDTHVEVLGRIEAIVGDSLLDDTGKVDQIRHLFTGKRMTTDQLQADRQRLQELKQVNQPIHQREDFYIALEKQSLRLQARVSGIVQELVFDQPASHLPLMAALRYFQVHKGELSAGASLPLDFLNADQRPRVFTESGKLRPSLYKALLFWQLRDHIRNGSVNVLSSYEHRAFDEYTLPRHQWETHRDAYLVKANLTTYCQPELTLARFNQRLNDQFKQTNLRLATNSQVFFDAAGAWHLHRYRAKEADPAGAVPSLYPTNRVVSLSDVLWGVNESTRFLEAFEHQGFAQKPQRPAERLLMAALIGYGENIGIRKMALISKNIASNALQTVATHYFSPEGVLKANDLILAKSNRLPLTDQFRRKADWIHTGSDGQKYDVSVPMLRASASYKYFGNGQGITIYSHLDEAGQLIYSTAFSAADREAPYMLDAITYNEVITPDAHATDQHGFSEPVFAIAGLLGVEFRPRFAQIHRQQLYSIDAVSTYRDLDYRMGPVARIDYEHLLSQWDEILRLVATIKLGYAKASQLFKRLNSYDRQHPLYRALRDLESIKKPGVNQVKRP